MTNTEGIRIRCVQLNPTIGDFHHNTEAMLLAMNAAETDQVDLLIFPELTTCGYLPLDLLEHHAFRDAAARARQKIVAATGNTAVLFGSIVPNTGFGRPLYNSAILAQHGEEIAVRHKTLLPTYDVFDELRYFEPAHENTPVLWNGVAWGITICEDVWTIGNEIEYHRYEQNPVADLVAAGAQIILNMSASPFTRKKAEQRRTMLAAHAQKWNIPLIYCNQCGGNTEIISDGDSLMVDAGGEIVATAGMFDSGAAEAVFRNGRLRATTLLTAGLPQSEERIFRAIVLGIRDYFRKTGIPPRVILGLSGGIDSALVAALACEAVGASNVTGITMPSVYSSHGSVFDSETLASNLGMELHRIPIQSVFESTLASLHPIFEDTAANVAEENIQSRIRGILLMGYSNKFGHLLLNTGNKSELAVGYCTLYGDMNGSLSVIADLYKTEVYALSRWMNTHYYMKEVIPESILQKAPSAELAPGQKDEDSLPPYEMLDAILYRFIELRHSVAEICRDHDPEVVRNVVRLVHLNEFKRRQAPPALKLSAKAFGAGRRIPIVHRFAEDGN